jgi:uncharacterized protein (DUF1697 family)
MVYVALLRGINVGGKNKVEMLHLKATFEKMGFTDVVTYINSGNVIFHTKRTRPALLEERIEKVLEGTFGFPIRTLVREGKNIEQVARGIPTEWPNDAKQKTDVLFLWEEYDHEKSIDLIKTKKGVDTLLYIAGAIAWNLNKKNYNKTGMRQFIGSEVYKHMTARNVNTVRKLAELVGEK